MPATSNTRHAVSRLTGTTTFIRPVKGVWTATCVNHKETATAANRTAAWKMGSTPSTFCGKCKAISAGKADKATDGLLDVPAGLMKGIDAPGSKPAPTKATTAPTKKASPAKPKETAAQRAARIKAEGFAKDKAASESAA